MTSERRSSNNSKIQSESLRVDEEGLDRADKVN